MLSLQLFPSFHETHIFCALFFLLSTLQMIPCPYLLLSVAVLGTDVRSMNLIINMPLRTLSPSLLSTFMAYFLLQFLNSYIFCWDMYEILSEILHLLFLLYSFMSLCNIFFLLICFFFFLRSSWNNFRDSVSTKWLYSFRYYQHFMKNVILITLILLNVHDLYFKCCKYCTVIIDAIYKYVLHKF